MLPQQSYEIARLRMTEQHREASTARCRQNYGDDRTPSRFRVALGHTLVEVGHRLAGASR